MLYMYINELHRGYHESLGEHKREELDSEKWGFDVHLHGEFEA